MCAFADSVAVFATFASESPAVDSVVWNDSIPFLGLGLLDSSILHFVLNACGTCGLSIDGWRHFNEDTRCVIYVRSDSVWIGRRDSSVVRVSMSGFGVVGSTVEYW
jgi:hypothetical protein